MNMVHHFFGHRFELRRTANAFRAKHGDRYDVVTTLDPAHVQTSDLNKAYAVAEFMLNLLEIKYAPDQARGRSLRPGQFRHKGRGVPHPSRSRFSPNSPPTKLGWVGFRW